MLRSAKQRRCCARQSNGNAALGRATARRTTDWRRYGGDVRGRLSYAQKRPAKVLQCAHCRGIARLFSATAKPSLEPQWQSAAQNSTGMALNRTAKAQRGLAQSRHATELQSVALQRRSKAIPSKGIAVLCADRQRQGRAGRSVYKQQHCKESPAQTTERTAME